MAIMSSPKLRKGGKKISMLDLVAGGDNRLSSLFVLTESTSTQKDVVFNNSEDKSAEVSSFYLCIIHRISTQI